MGKTARTLRAVSKLPTRPSGNNIPAESPAALGVSHIPAVPLAAAPPAAKAESDAEPLEAIVDGKRVVLDARDEIVLRCGKASITLRRNGRIVIRGTYVETRSQGTNRIKGGSVQIN
jgi:hypothetical protein